MKIYGSLFLWIPLLIFGIWLGIKDLSDNDWVVIQQAALFLLVGWNIFIGIVFISNSEMRKDLKDMVKESFAQSFILVLICHILIIPIITYYLNDKFTIKI